MTLMAVKKTPGQREQRFCSSSQESGTAFIYCRRVCIINYYYLGRWWGYVHQLRTRTSPATSNARIDDLCVQPYILQMYVMPQGRAVNCHGSPVPVCMHLHTYGGKVYRPWQLCSRPPPILLWRGEAGRPLPASSGRGE